MNKTTMLRLTLAVAALTLIVCSCTQDKVVEKYDNGKAKVIQILKKKDGSLQQVGEKRLYENGKERMSGKISEGKRTGVWKFYFESGELFAKADFTDNQQGKNWEVYDHEGKQLVSKSDKIAELHFAQDGGLCDIRIKQDDKELLYRFFESFRVCVTSQMKGNIPNGETIAWFENGKMNSYYYYRDGIQDSIYRVYTEDGGLLVSGQYNKGIKVGKWEYYLSDSSPSGIEIYDTDGTKLKSRE